MDKRLILALLSVMILLPLLVGFTVGGDDNIVTIGKDVTLDANSLITNNVVVFGGNATIRGQVQENVVVIFGNIYLESGSVVRGDAVAVLGAVVRQGDAQVYGESVSVDMASLNLRDWRFSGMRWPMHSAWRGPASIWRVFWVVMLGLVVMWAAPRVVSGVSVAVTADPVKSVLYGLLSYLALVPLTIIMLISLLGIPLIPLFWSAVAVGRLVGQVALGLIAGRYILRQTETGGQSPTVAAVIGLLVLGVITLIPVLGSFAA
ncbi:MAG TPA: hypothetical protein VK905_01680 [Bacillota bacterium]|nr:hypothetical protein [Bacillota bacterium]